MAAWRISIMAKGAKSGENNHGVANGSISEKSACARKQRNIKA